MSVDWVGDPAANRIWSRRYVHKSWLKIGAKNAVNSFSEQWKICGNLHATKHDLGESRVVFLDAHITSFIMDYWSDL